MIGFGLYYYKGLGGGGRGCDPALTEAAKRVENRKAKCGRALSRVKNLPHESNPRAVGCGKPNLATVSAALTNINSANLEEKVLINLIY